MNYALKFASWSLLLTMMLPIFGCGPRAQLPPEAPNRLNSESASQKPASPETNATAREPAGEPAQLSTHVLFNEVHAALGVNHVFDNGARGQLLAVETLGGGCGWIDYDLDGRIDIILNQGGNPAATNRAGQPVDGLFRNLGHSFRQVDVEARLADNAFSQAVAVGDFDNDGFQDIYISNVSANTLWMNCGDGSFVEVGQAAGVADPRWSTTSAWADLDLDGDLDLYVCNYLNYDPLQPTTCLDDQQRVVLCNPSKLEPWPDACYINQGDGTFLEQSNARGLVGPGSRGLAVAVADFNNDRWPDIYVANDTNDNFLFSNLGHGYFEENAKLLGCATDHLGMPQASMGLAVNDFDRNGFLDIYVTHYTAESNTLYQNFGNHGFQDVTGRMGLHQSTLPYLGFGSVMQDFDQDGEMELFVANGHVATAPHQADPRMKPQLFSYTGLKKWRDISQLAGPVFNDLRMSRGVATADYDNDGDLDLLILNLNDPAYLLRNDSERGQWLSLSFVGSTCNRYGIGVRAEVTAGERTYVGELCGGTSFAAANQPHLHFGLGDFAGNVSLRILWPGGDEQLLPAVPLGQHRVIRQMPSE